MSKLKTNEGIDVVISCDTTGSMYPCLTQARRNIEALVRRLFRDISDLRIAIKVHGDYCDAGSTYVTKTLDFSTNVEQICNFVKSVGSTYGGDAPECYELVLHEARSLSWKAERSRVLILIGDDVPHERNYALNTKRLDWRNELKMLKEMGVNVYGVHAMPGIRQHSKSFYATIANETGGYYLTLDQFAAIEDIIYAICYKQSGKVALDSFQQEVEKRGGMNRNMANVFQTLTGKRMTIKERPDLVSVPAGRFQVLSVDDDQSIKDFVEDQGLIFNKGRGFYEFMKTETIQENKEVVLMDDITGDMFFGDKAREMIGLPYGIRGRIKPENITGYTVFVQSTSYNRKLIGGTRFLYEVVDR